MYNGIGLDTPRGSGTNDCTQTNKFFVWPRATITPAAASGRPVLDESNIGVVKKADMAVLEHNRKRQIQLKLLHLEEALADQGCTDCEIAERLDDVRKVLEAESAVHTGAMGGDDKRMSEEPDDADEKKWKKHKS